MKFSQWFSSCLSLFAFHMVLTLPNVNAEPPSFVRAESEPAYVGTPGARILSLHFTDEMKLLVAIYRPKHSSGKPPIGIIGGYGSDVSFLHYFATQLNEQGFPVFLVQPPGHGRLRMASDLPSGEDGYHNTIEGMAALYMDGLGEAMYHFFNQKVVLLGYSRGGYQVRAFLTGLRYDGERRGEAVLVYRPEQLEIAKQHYLAFGSLFSPLSPDPRLTDLIRVASEIESSFDSPLSWLRDLNPFIGVPRLRRLAESASFVMGDYNAMDSAGFRHAMYNLTLRPPSERASAEMLGLGDLNGSALGWRTLGVDPNGKSYLAIRAFGKAQTESEFPYFIIAASGDGNPRAVEREAKFACALGTCEVEGNHGDAVFRKNAVISAGNFLGRICAQLL